MMNPLFSKPVGAWHQVALHGAAGLLLCLLLCLSQPLHAQTSAEAEQIENYASRYVGCKDPGSRLKLANDFFSYLLESGYIDEPIRFPAGSHIDSVDVNVFYYAAEFLYGEGSYQKAIDLLTSASQRTVVDDASRSDVYGLLGAAYFRMSAYDKAAKALHHCYLLDKKSGDFDRLSSTLNSIASVLTAAGKPREAEKYISEAIAANSLTDNLARRAVLFGTASELYRSLDDKQQALEYAQKALETERLTGDSARIGIRLSQLASAQMSLSKASEARRSLQQAIPLLYKARNYHSWGICQNQLGDILESEGKNPEAAQCYLEAAMLFLKQGDKYNELHAREGLYRTTKASAPSQAMLHLERAKLLQDSIYQTETSEALAKYNALYYNDILQEQAEASRRQSRLLLLSVGIGFVVALTILVLAIVYTYRRHRHKVMNYEQQISQAEDQNAQIYRQYQNVVANALQSSGTLTDDDREFLEQLGGVIYLLTEKGVSDVDTIASHMHINTVTLRRRLSQMLDVTPKKYILQTRMEKAKYLLQQYSDITIAEVAERCGYAQVPNFTRAFKNFYGIMPSEVKNERMKE